MKLLTLGILSVCLIAISGSVFAGPQLVLPETSFDFGFVPQHSRISHTFWIKSVGDDDLKILKVIPGCGCTQAPLENKLVPPGDSTRLEIIFSTKQYKSLVQKRPKIKTNEGSGDKVLSFKANVVDNNESTYPLVISPFVVNFTQAGNKQNNEFVITLSNVSEQDLELSLIDFADEIFDVKLPNKIKAGQAAKAKIKLNEESQAEAFVKSITIEVNDANKSRFTIPVKQNIKLAKK
jgi:uncharacterized protein DUF1573